MGIRIALASCLLHMRREFTRMSDKTLWFLA